VEATTGEVAVKVRAVVNRKLQTATTTVVTVPRGAQSPTRVKKPAKQAAKQVLASVAKHFGKGAAFSCTVRAGGGQILDAPKGQLWIVLQKSLIVAADKQQELSVWVKPSEGGALEQGRAGKRVVTIGGDEAVNCTIPEPQPQRRTSAIGRKSANASESCEEGALAKLVVLLAKLAATPGESTLLDLAKRVAALEALVAQLPAQAQPGPALANAHAQSDGSNAVNIGAAGPSGKAAAPPKQQAAKKGTRRRGGRGQRRSRRRKTQQPASEPGMGLIKGTDTLNTAKPVGSKQGAAGGSAGSKQGAAGASAGSKQGDAGGSAGNKQGDAGGPAGSKQGDTGGSAGSKQGGAGGSAGAAGGGGAQKTGVAETLSTKVSVANGNAASVETRVLIKPNAAVSAKQRTTALARGLTALGGGALVSGHPDQLMCVFSAALAAVGEHRPAAGKALAEVVGHVQLAIAPLLAQHKPALTALLGGAYDGVNADQLNKAGNANVNGTSVLRSTVELPIIALLLGVSINVYSPYVGDDAGPLREVPGTGCAWAPTATASFGPRVVDVLLVDGHYYTVIERQQLQAAFTGKKAPANAEELQTYLRIEGDIKAFAQLRAHEGVDVEVADPSISLNQRLERAVKLVGLHAPRHTVAAQIAATLATRGNAGANAGTSAGTTNNAATSGSGSNHGNGSPGVNSGVDTGAKGGAMAANASSGGTSSRTGATSDGSATGTDASSSSGDRGTGSPGACGSPDANTNGGATIGTSSAGMSGGSSRDRDGSSTARTGTGHGDSAGSAPGGPNSNGTTGQSGSTPSNAGTAAAARSTGSGDSCDGDSSDVDQLEVFGTASQTADSTDTQSVASLTQLASSAAAALGSAAALSPLGTRASKAAAAAAAAQLAAATSSSAGAGATRRASFGVGPRPAGTGKTAGTKGRADKQ
jgi:hypothetical protein